MKKQHDLASSSNQDLPGFDTSSLGSHSNVEPFTRPIDRLDRVEDEDAVEDSDRDTDFTLGFREEFVEEDEAFDSLLPEELEEESHEMIFEEQTAFLKSEANTFSDFDDPQDDAWLDSDGVLELASELAEEEEDELDETWDTEPVPESLDGWDDTLDEAFEAPNTSWQQQTNYIEAETQEPWPWSLLVIGALALVLVVAGGYGVMQQRSATQEEIRQLRANLATAVNPQEVESSRAALQDSKERNIQLTEAINSLRLQNQRLTDTVAGLEAQLAALQNAGQKPIADKPAAPAQPATPVRAAEPPAAARPAAPKPAPAPSSAATTGSGGDWFVNFGSYGQRSMAEEWARKLQPGSGKVIVVPGQKAGQTFYRVRVVNLDTRQSAEGIARQLERNHGLPKLWVGQQ